MSIYISTLRQMKIVKFLYLLLILCNLGLKNLFLNISKFWNKRRRKDGKSCFLGVERNKIKLKVKKKGKKGEN